MSINLLLLDGPPITEPSGARQAHSAAMGSAAMDSAVVAFGGLPAAPESVDFAWPTCSGCSGSLKYLGRVPHPIDTSKRVLLFQCGNMPGMCDDWDAESGGNRALVISAVGDVRTVARPTTGVTILDCHWAGTVHPASGKSYDAARSRAIESGTPSRGILGCLAGEPEWVQGDETPECPGCERPMILAAQLEEGPDHGTAMNFGGGGCAYVFVCSCPLDEARFLWQC